MRCEDCLPLIEEYFDGEVGGRTGGLMRAHLSTCETCAAALDALSFEQEVYARYDRGLEVSPTLWARVSAEIAREPEAREPERPFLSGLRARLAAFTPAAIFARPALASSLALLLVGVTAGSLWLARRPQTVAPAEVAVNTPGAGLPNAPAPAEVKAGGAAAAATALNTPDALTGEASFVPASAPREAAQEIAAAARTQAAPAGAREVDVETLLAESSAPKTTGSIVVIRPDEHAAEDSALFVNTSASDTVVGREAPLLDPGQKDVARHVEQTQMLLRSIKNARPASDNSVDIAYEKNLSRRLLADNVTLQLDAEVRGDKDTKQVLDQIEPFLLDIANMREKASREDVRSIRERVTKNEIIAALQVY